jgi:hypothetical protein
MFLSTPKKKLATIGVLATAIYSGGSAMDSSRATEMKAQPVVVIPKAEPKIEPPPVLQQEPRRAVHTSKVEYEWLAKICVSEGGFNFEECSRILQTLENMKGNKSLLFIMQAQAARITRVKPFTDPRQIWISYLPMKGTEAPKGWIECKTRRDPPGCTGTWASTVKNWVYFREQVRELYYSGIVPESVPGKPIQWGGDMDYWYGVERNFCPLNEGSGMRNTYWGDPKDPENEGKCLPIIESRIKESKTLSATIASGRALKRHRIPLLLGESMEN